MGLPQQVQKQLEVAEAYDKRLAGDAKPDQTEQEPEPQPVAEDANKPEVTDQSPVAALQQQVAELTARLNDENNPTFKARWTSLQGMYQSQVQQIKQLTEQVEALQTAQQADKQPSSKSSDPLVTKTDVEAFGEDLIDVIRRGAREEISRQAATYEEKIAALTAELQAARKDVGHVVQNQVQTQQDQFFAALGASIPKWQEIQATKECQEFLGSLIPGTRTEWNSVLLDAANAFDVPRVLQVFEQFFARYPKYAPKARTQQPNRSELERQVAPSKAGSAPSPQTAKRVYTGAEYQAESMRLIRLAQQGKHDDATSLEAELNAAIAEGRVR